MRLIDKLAQDAAKEALDHLYRAPMSGVEAGMQAQHYASFEAIWKDGFRKAREMMADSIVKEIGCAGLDTVGCDQHMGELETKDVPGEAG